jgi:carbon storage regulator
MLVLTRGKQDSIVLGDHIVVTILDIRGDKVRVGIEAPRSMTILRKEIYDEILKENIDASNQAPENLDGLDDLFGPPPSS